MAIDNLSFFNAMNREEVKPPFPQPHRPLTSQEAHFAIMEKVNACIHEVNMFEQRVRQEMDNYFDRMTVENQGFKEAIQASYNAFMETVQREVNNFEIDTQNNFDLFRNDIDKRVADFETAINNSFTTLQGELIKASDAKIAELEELRVTLNKEYTAFRTEIQGLFNAFKTSVNQHMEEQDGKIEEYKNYMVDNILASTETIFNKKASNGEITEIMKTVYGDSRSFKGSLTYAEITALTDATNGDYYYCSDDEHYYQKTETAWVDIGTGDNTLNNLLAFQTLTSGEQAVTEAWFNGALNSIDVEERNIVDVIELTMNDNFTLMGNGTLVEYNDYNIRVSEPVDVVAGELLIVGGLNYILTDGNVNPYCAFYDVNGDCVKAVRNENMTTFSNYGTGYCETVIAVPFGAQTVRICDFPDNGIYGKLQKIKYFNFKDTNLNNYVKTVFDNIIEYINKDTFNFETLGVTKNTACVLSMSGIVKEMTSGDLSHFVTDFINVDEGAIYYIKTTQGYSNRRWEIIDKTGCVIDYELADTTLTTKDSYIIIPKNGCKIRFCSNETNYDFKKVINFNKTAVVSDLPWCNKKWVCVGDSLTEVNSRASKFYHDYVSEEMGIEVVNMGKSGSGYLKQYDSNNAFYQRILNVPTDADVVTIFGSFNDLSSGAEIGTVDDTGTETLAGAINTTLDNLFTAYPLAKVGVVTPTPWSGVNETNDSVKDEAYVQVIIDICKKRSIPLLDLYHNSGLRPWEETYRQLMYTKDDGNGVHPDENGHAVIAPRFREFLKTLI